MERHTRQTSIDAEQEFIFKILVIGEVGTGKTSLIRRYVSNVFREFNKPTIGVDFALKNIKWTPDTVVRLQLWDIAGQERFGHMTRVYYREAVGAAVIFDVTRPSTFEAVSKWKTDLDSKVNTTLPDGTQAPIPAVLIVNKCDLLEDGGWSLPVSRKEMDAYCQENGFLGWYETSAKEEKFFPTTDAAFRCLVKQVISNESEQPVINILPPTTVTNLPINTKGCTTTRCW